jgi:hypothetical protein
MTIFCPFSSFSNKTPCDALDDFLIADTIAPPGLTFFELRRDFHFDVSAKKFRILEILSVVFNFFYVMRSIFPVSIDMQDDRPSRNSEKKYARFGPSVENSL